MKIRVLLKYMLHTLALAAALAALSGCGMSGNAANGQAILTVAAERASNPTIAIAPKSETVFVAWIGAAGEKHNVYLARMERGEERFSAPVQVNDVVGEAAPHAEAPAKIAVGPEGNVYVLWHNNRKREGHRFPGSNLRFARSTDGGNTFSPAIYVNDDFNGPVTSHNFHALTVAQDGAIYVSWLDGRDTTFAPQVRVACSQDGGQSFKPSVAVAHQVCACCRTALATDAEGSVYVMYRDVQAGEVRDLAIARSDDHGQTFTAPARVHNDGWVLQGCPHNGPSLRVDGNGYLHAAWYTGKEDRFGVYYAVSKNRGESFEMPFHLNALLQASVSRADLAVAREGEPYLVCEVTDAKGASIYLLGPKLAPANKMQAQNLAPGIYPVMAKHEDLLALAWLDGEAVRAVIKPL